MTGKHWLTALAVAAALMLGTAAGCQWLGLTETEEEAAPAEHPTEHPTEQPAAGEHPTEHPTGAEHPTGQPAAGEHPTEHPTGAEHPTEHPAAIEHPTPEHPMAALPTGELVALRTGAEHPAEHPKPLTKEELAEQIKGYVVRDTELKNGYFLIYDEVGEEVLMLRLDKVHEERLAQTSPGVYFACSDFKVTIPEGMEGRFKSPDGKVYDLDFWMKQTETGAVVTEILIHKEAGEPRYNWVQRGGFWETVPAE